jgi:hypothetical protein
MNSRRIIRAAGLAMAGVMCLAASTSSHAQSPATGVAVTAEPALTPAQHLLSDRLVIDAGAFVLAPHTSATLNGQTTVGTRVDFDQAFGTNADSTRVRADILWRFLPRHHLRFLYFDNSITRTRTIDKDIIWGDYTFQLGGQVSAQNKITVLELAYEYAFVRDPNYEVAATAGVHYSKLSLGLSGNATLTLPDGTVLPASFQTKTSSLPAPLPVIGLRGGWAIAPNWHLDAQGQVFDVKVDNYNGNWWDLRAGVTWMYNRHVGIGAGWNKFTTRVDVDRTNFHGSLTTGYSGVLVYLTGSF